MRNRLSIKPDAPLGIIGIFGIGIVLRCLNYFPHSSLHFDELTSALNIRDRSFYQLATESLDHNQVAPVGFLWLEKAATLLFGVNDLAYRFFPFAFSVLSMALFYSICKLFLKGATRLGALLSFAVSIAMINYAGEAKQYSGEIAASLFLVWSALKLLQGPLKPATVGLMALGGSLFILCSLPAVITAPLVLAGVFVAVLKKKTALPLQPFMAVAISWALACLLVAYHAKFVIAKEVQQAMSGYWSVGFAPLVSPGDFMLWLPQSIYRECSFFLIGWMDEYLPALRYLSLALLVLAVPGVVFLIRKSRLRSFILFVPLLTALLLAVLHLLPFFGRVSIYATWPVLIGGMAGIAALQQRFHRLFTPVIVRVTVAVIGIPILTLPLVHKEAKPPYNAQSAQPVLRALKKQMQPGDVLYVYFKARHALHFYGPEEGITEYRIGGGYQTIEPFLREMDALKGCRRVWFFFTQWTPQQPFPDSIKTYLGTVIGKEVSNIPDPDGFTGQAEVAAHLYDLSTTL